MNHKLYHIDAFTNTVFRGNSACVVLLGCRLEDDVLLRIAAENAVAETAFLFPENGRLSLRWFTPDLEMDLCGHATLAAAYVVFHFIPEYVGKGGSVVFDTCEGEIKVGQENTPEGKILYCLDFPSRPGKPAELPEALRRSLSKQPSQVYLSRDYLLIYESAEDVRTMQINRAVFDTMQLGTGGVIVSAPGPELRSPAFQTIGPCDFVSRFFTPQATILEDPVTGSAHCTLAPYWGERLGKTTLHARQISARSGELQCVLTGGRVILKGEAVCYLTGKVSI